MAHQQSPQDGWYSYSMPPPSSQSTTHSTPQNSHTNYISGNIPPQNANYYQSGVNQLPSSSSFHHTPKTSTNSSYASSPYAHVGNSGSATSFIHTSQLQGHSEVSYKFSIWDIIGVGNIDGTEPPLLEGIKPSHIAQKSLAVLVPFGKIDPELMNDSDLAGPIAICLLLGSCLLISGKIHFGYIYGLSMLGWFSIFILVNLMAEEGKGIDGARSASVLGYSLLPMVPLGPLLSATAHLLKAFNVPNFIYISSKIGIGMTMVLWSTLASSSIFASVLQMQHQRFLIAYPLCMLYTCFALLSVF